MDENHQIHLNPSFDRGESNSFGNIWRIQGKSTHDSENWWYILKRNAYHFEIYTDEMISELCFKVTQGVHDSCRASWNSIGHIVT